jgi:hypothetical protein
MHSEIKGVFIQFFVKNFFLLNAKKFPLQKKTVFNQIVELQCLKMWHSDLRCAFITKISSHLSSVHKVIHRFSGWFRGRLRELQNSSLCCHLRDDKRKMSLAIFLFSSQFQVQ